MTIKRRYFICSVFLVVVTASVGAVAQDRPATEMKESDLIALLQSEAPADQKAITCKQLVICGTQQCVPALAPLLRDKELASWARIALEAIPGPAADTALRHAMGEVEGRLLVGVINSIGVRRDAQAVTALVQKLSDTDSDVASAAAVALGHIGGPQAAQALTQTLARSPVAVRSAAAEGCILCAEGFLVAGKTTEAIKLYDTVRQADLPDQRHLEAIRGAILARQSEGIPLLIEQLQSADRKRLDVGLRTARELPGRDVTEALAAQLTQISAERRPMLLLALSDRHDPAVLPTVHHAAQSGPQDLRLTAINILVRLGNVSSVPVLLNAATENNAELQKAAVETLVRLPGEDVDSDLVGRLPQANDKTRQVLIVLVGQRQISNALAAVVPSLHDADAGIRGAAVQTVGIIGQDPQAADLVKLLQETSNSSERAGIQKSLLSISGRCGHACVAHLLTLTKSPDSELHMIGLHALAVVGGSEALAAVKSSMGDAEPAVQDEAVRILSTWPNNWPDDSEAGQALLTLATSAKKTSHQVLGLRGYLQYLRVSKKLSHDQKVAQVKTLWSRISQAEEKHLAIAALAEAPSPEALELLTGLVNDPAVAEEAYSAMVQIAGQDVPGLSRDRRRGVLQMVLDKSTNNGTRQRARKALGGVR